jgi:hypothetical protein
MPLEPYIPANVQAAADASDSFLRGLESPPAEAPSPSALAQPPSPPVQTQEPPKDDAAEQRYRVLQGKYNAEVPRLHEANRTLQAQNQELSQRLQGLEAKVQELNKPAPVTQNFDSIHKEFGDDLTNVLKEQAATIQRLNGTIEQLQSGQARVAQATQETAQAAFWRELRRDVPDVDALNRDQYFLAWLDEADGLSGTSRYDTMQVAFRRLDASGVARYFTSYKAGLKSAPSPQEQLQSQVSPPASGTGAYQAADSKPTYTSAQVSQFFKELSLGKWNHRREEAEALERSMEAAQLEGRIR